MGIQKITQLTLLGAMAVTVLSGQPDSRQAEISAAQEQKATQLRPEQANQVERGLNRVTEGALLQRITGGIGGFRAKFGGLAPGSGFAIGPEYRRGDLLNGRLSFSASAQASFRGYRKFAIELAAPKISGGPFFAQFNAVHHNYPGMSYYGPGPDSSKTGRSDFRLEDTAVDLTFGVRPLRHVTLGSSAGYLFNNIGPGTDARYASAETLYSPVHAPGIDVQANYLRVGGFAQYDWRDNPGGPRRGGNYFAQFNDYRDRTFGAGNFRRLDLEAQQFVSVLNQRRVFALRGRTTLTYRDGSQPIPFYMQPSLGGAEDLRGYRPFRFRDDNLFVMNAEYRWEVFSGLDMALFGDAGKVFHRKSDFDLAHLESDVGFGFRFNARNQTFLRMDVGFSHEGFQVWVRFNNVFGKGPVRTSSSMGDF
jgi:outer membrane protein assembly factor BamA